MTHYSNRQAYKDTLLDTYYMEYNPKSVTMKSDTQINAEVNPESPYDSRCKIEPAHRLATCTKIFFTHLETVTQKDNPKGGALLVTLIPASPTQEFPHSQWLPKKLCCNLEFLGKAVNKDTGEEIQPGNVYVWEVFMAPLLEKLVDEGKISDTYSS